MTESSKRHEQMLAAMQAIVEGNANRLEELIFALKEDPFIKRWHNIIGDESNISEQVRNIIVSEHSFNNWQEFEKFKQLLNAGNTSVALFETAVDAVVSGDLLPLKQMLQQNPGLVNMRSVRKHRATLLTYVGANGVEDFRQKTPANAVEIAETLLGAGAEVDAIADLYGGTTTLGLIATSVHPLEAGVQKELIDFFLEAGADINRAVALNYTEGNLIVACLHNGRGEAAAYLSEKNVPLDLEGAAGTGWLDVVRTYYNNDGILKDGTNTSKRDLGFMWACEYGHMNVMLWMLQNGFDLSTIADGMTGLHWAVVGGRIDIIKLLLSKGAPLEIKNCYGGTALGQALWSACNEPKAHDSLVIEILINAGAKIEPEWQVYIDEIKKR